MSKKVLCYDNLSARTFKSTIAKIEAAFVSLERLLMENGDATLNDYYDLVGLPPIGLGEEYGWSGQTVQPRLGAVLTRKLRPAVSVDFSTNPVAAYRNY